MGYDKVGLGGGHGFGGFSDGVKVGGGAVGIGSWWWWVQA